MRAIDVRVAGGLSALVLADRGLDIGPAWVAGQPLAGRARPASWRRPTSTRRWLRSFHGGLLVTCGLQNVGPASVDGGVSHGVHGRASGHPGAHGVTHRVVEDRGRLVAVVTGEVRETDVYGVDLVLRRSLRFPMGEPLVELHDEVVNQGYGPAGLMLLYHCNIGYPVVADGAVLLAPDAEVVPRDPPAQAACADTRRSPPRTTRSSNWSTSTRLRDPDATSATIAIANPGYAPTGGIAVGVTYDPRQLPHLWQWRMLAPGMYLTGLEPATCGILGRPAERGAGHHRVARARRAPDLRPDDPRARPGRPSRSWWPPIVAAWGGTPMTDATITAVDVMTIQATLPAPVIFGDWIMHTREFALVRVQRGGRPAGYAYTLTRDGAVAEQIRKTIARIYTGTDVDDRERTFTTAWRRSLASHSAGIGLRALSHRGPRAAGTSRPGDATCPSRRCWAAGTRRCPRPRSSATRRARWVPRRPAPRPRSCTRRAGGASRRPPAAPPSGPPLACGRRARRLRTRGWAWTPRGSTTIVDAAADFVQLRRRTWAWAGSRTSSRRATRASCEPCATRTSDADRQGDEQGGSYYPEALILAQGRGRGAHRPDLHGRHHARPGDHRPGAGRGRCTFAPHMFPHVHAQVLGRVGLHRRAHRVGHPVHGRPPHGRLRCPSRSSGRAAGWSRSPEAPGFGHLVDADWVRSQPHDDSGGILAGL